MVSFFFTSSNLFDAPLNVFIASKNASSLTPMLLHTFFAPIKLSKLWRPKTCNGTFLSSTIRLVTPFSITNSGTSYEIDSTSLRTLVPMSFTFSSSAQYINFPLAVIKLANCLNWSLYISNVGKTFIWSQATPLIRATLGL